MIPYFLALCLIGLCAYRQVKLWQAEDDEAAIDAILTEWARMKRHERDRLGRFKKHGGEYGRFTISPNE